MESRGDSGQARSQQNGLEFLLVLALSNPDDKRPTGEVGSLITELTTRLAQESKKLQEAPGEVGAFAGLTAAPRQGVEPARLRPQPPDSLKHSSYCCTSTLQISSKSVLVAHPDQKQTEGNSGQHSLAWPSQHIRKLPLQQTSLLYDFLTMSQG